MSNIEQMKKLIKAYSGSDNHIGFPRVYYNVTKDINMALMLNQLVFWSDKTKRTDGYFYKTYQEWEYEILLSQYQVKKASEKLTELGILHTKILKANGAPTLHYKVDLGVLSKLLMESEETSQWNMKKLNNGLSSNLIMENEETKQSITEDYTKDYNTEDYTEYKPSKADALDSEFEQWWKLYDKKIDKKKAKQRFKSCRKKHSLDEIMKGTHAYLKTIKDKQYQKYPTTFLNGESYLDVEGYEDLTSNREIKSMAEELGLKCEPVRELTEEEKANIEEVDF